MIADFLWGGKPAKFRKEILEYPYDLGGLQLHNLQRFSTSPKTTWLRRIISTNSSWTTFAIAYEIDKCWNLGNDFAKQKKNTITNTFWKDVVQSIINLRENLKLKTDLDYLCWPLWHDQIIKLPLLKKLKNKNVCMVSDLLGINWEIMAKEEIEMTRGVNLNFLENLSIKQSIKRFIKNADKQRVNIGPYRPYLLNIVFSQKKGCQDIYRKTGHYGNQLLREVSHKWEIDLIQNIEHDEVQQSIRLLKKKNRNMYLWDIQYKIWYTRVATNAKLFQMNIKDTEHCEYCEMRETNVHAFVSCERTHFWAEITFFFEKIRI